MTLDENHIVQHGYFIIFSARLLQYREANKLIKQPKWWTQMANGILSRLHADSCTVDFLYNFVF